ncbi:hypothetical protein [Vulcanisaeta sp. JCM 14467]|uniref:hypothetical protein n=1 Tax=Vulcanisaeta sp. JCM 14467 TaxID=1295370 RepID=UPI0006D0CDD9|nr:hypothetical protein [Vulcanisaeta sp. JCM 14467]
MLREVLRNRFVIVAYIIGVITVVLATYIILNPFSVKYYYKGLPINGSFTVNPSEIIFLILETNDSNLGVNVTVIKWIPETNITLTLYYTASLGPYQLKELNFTTITRLNLTSIGNGEITIIGIYRPEVINVLAIVLTILFIMVIALLIIGFIESIINIHGKA